MILVEGIFLTGYEYLLWARPLKGQSDYRTRPTLRSDGRAQRILPPGSVPAQAGRSACGLGTLQENRDLLPKGLGRLAQCPIKWIPPGSSGWPRRPVLVSKVGELLSSR